MDARTIDVINECSKGSDEGQLSFPQVVGKLMDAGIERYSVDFVRNEKTFYQQDGEFFSLQGKRSAGEPAQEFSASDVQAAIRKSQTGSIAYLEFCRLAKEAGCTGYLVSLKGRRAVYSGRSGEDYAELFPGSMN